mmetsp:Transcript_34667/g.95520  ORF Transcript_34667/g.95520 Transcript_34667/m.95520 type:complete len:358 (+) Transcript_34667:2303-3376(+)
MTLASASSTSGKTVLVQISWARGCAGHVRRSNAAADTAAFRTRMESSLASPAKKLVSKKATTESASRPTGDWRRGRMPQKKASAALRTIGFSSAAQPRNILAKWRYCWCASSVANVRSCRTPVSPQRAKNCIAVATPPSARLRTVGIASWQRRTNCRRSLCMRPARALSAASPQFGRSSPLRSSAETAMSVANERTEVRSFSNARARNSKNRPAAPATPGAACAACGSIATSTPSSASLWPGGGPAFCLGRFAGRGAATGSSGGASRLASSCWRSTAEASQSNDSTLSAAKGRHSERSGAKKTMSSRMATMGSFIAVPCGLRLRAFRSAPSASPPSPPAASTVSAAAPLSSSSDLRR